MSPEQTLQPQPGKFYRSKDGQIWCCFRARPLVKDYGTHIQSYCVRVTDCRVTYFLDDHSFDEGGEIEHVLVATADLKDIPDWHLLPPFASVLPL